MLKITLLFAYISHFLSILILCSYCKDIYDLRSGFPFMILCIATYYKCNEYVSVLSVCVLYYSLVTAEVGSMVETGKQGGVGGVQQVELEDAHEKIK